MKCRKRSFAVVSVLSHSCCHLVLVREHSMRVTLISTLSSLRWLRPLINNA